MRSGFGVSSVLSGMANSAIAILTFNRVAVLRNMLEGLFTHCRQYPIAIFDDRSRDTTPIFLKNIARDVAKSMKTEVQVIERPDLMATLYKVGQLYFFLGDRNIGVSGNSNRALKWFMDETKAEHLCLCNDDMLVSGNFPAKYANGHDKLKIHLFCFCDFTSEPYRTTSVPVRAGEEVFQLKLMPRMTGMMMSLTRQLVERIGYYNTNFGPFGEEHCDYTNRARFSGGIKIGPRWLHCVDLDLGENPPLKSQVCDTSVKGESRAVCDQIASQAMAYASKHYRVQSWYFPFTLLPTMAPCGLEGTGIDYKHGNAPKIVDLVC